MRGRRGKDQFVWFVCTSQQSPQRRACGTSPLRCLPALYGAGAHVLCRTARGGDGAVRRVVYVAGPQLEGWVPGGISRRQPGLCRAAAVLAGDDGYVGMAATQWLVVTLIRVRGLCFRRLTWSHCNPAGWVHRSPAAAELELVGVWWFGSWSLVDVRGVKVVPHLRPRTLLLEKPRERRWPHRACDKSQCCQGAREQIWRMDRDGLRVSASPLQST